jgi:ornithine decarboxylase
VTPRTLYDAAETHWACEKGNAVEYSRQFKFLVVDAEIGQATVSGELIDRIVEAIEQRGYEVRTTHSTEGAKLEVESDATLACFLLRWGGQNVDALEIMDFIEYRGLEAPVFLVTEKHRLTELPSGVLKRIRGTIIPHEDTPEFIAKYAVRAYDEYVEGLKTPFFGGMIDYVEAGNEMWLAPGHNGGMFYLKSPIGKVLFDYLGETFWRADFNFVPDLGDIFGHTGKYLEAEQDAARIFGAERTYFVLNGTTTSNKIVNCALVAKDDLVLFDRNNHKSNHQSALMINGGIPVYLPDDRNHYGMVGPVDINALDEDTLRQRIKDNPLVKDPDAWKKERPFRAAIIENCTYDGTIYDVREVVRRIGHLCEYIFFDEAWGAFMHFHPIYRGRYAMGMNELTEDDPGLFVTQSTHKQLAGMSQASQVHVKDSHIDGQHRRINHKRFNEVYMMHMSTSPFYPMFASLDVGAQMMKGRNGKFLWDESLRLSIDLRRQLRHLAAENREQETDARKQWFFDPFVPDVLTIKDSPHTSDLVDVRWEDVPTDVLVNEQQCWMFKEGASWHGYTQIAGDYAMVDPSKMLLLTPGIDRKSGGYTEHGVPAPVLGAYMRSKGIVPEKTDLYLILFLITPGIERSKAGTLLAELIAFKEAIDQNVPMEDILPDVVTSFPDTYAGKRIGDVCQAMHELLVKHDASRLQREIFQLKHFPELAMTPQDAQNALIANNVDYVSLDDVKGRIAATLALVYPPGIGVIMPGERWDDNAQPQLDYFEMFEDYNTNFPGFENEVQGCYEEKQPDGSIKYYTYVVKEEFA